MYELSAPTLIVWLHRRLINVSLVAGCCARFRFYRAVLFPSFFPSFLFPIVFFLFIWLLFQLT